MAGTQDNIKGALEKSWDFIKDSSIRISFEAFKTYRITRLKFEKNGIKKSLDAKYREIGEITHKALKEGEEIEEKTKDLCKEVDDLHCNTDIVDQEIEKIEKEEPPLDTEQKEEGAGETQEVEKAADAPPVADVQDAPGKASDDTAPGKEAKD